MFFFRILRRGVSDSFSSSSKVFFFFLPLLTGEEGLLKGKNRHWFWFQKEAASLPYPRLSLLSLSLFCSFIAREERPRRSVSAFYERNTRASDTIYTRRERSRTFIVSSSSSAALIRFLKLFLDSNLKRANERKKERWKRCERRVRRRREAHSGRCAANGCGNCAGCSS